MKRIATAIWLLTPLLSCQKPVNDDLSPPKYSIGQGFVQPGQGKETISINLADFAAGQRLVLMPFALGSTDTIDGSNASLFNMTWNIAQQPKTSSQSFGSDFIDFQNDLAVWQPETGDSADLGSPDLGGRGDHFWRSFWNRFDPLDRQPTNDDLTQTMVNNWLQDASSLSNQDGDDGLLERLNGHRSALSKLGALAKQSPPQTTKTGEFSTQNFSTALLSGGCPTIFYLPGSSKVDDSTTYEEYSISSSEIASYFDGDDHCIVFMTNPVSESSIETIKASVRAVLDRYKTVIYQDTFSAIGTYSFKPLIVIADFSGPQWPPASTNKELQIAGAFFKGLSTQMKRPALYIASDLTKLSTPFPAASAKSLFHSTIAHEMQHAIMDYFKNRKAGKGSETLALDEGYAHLMEDVFGYGTDNFDSYAKPYLAVVPDGIEGALKGNGAAGALPNISRGAAQSFLYYLASRQGGFAVSSGVIAESGGLAFIRAAVTSKALGVANLSAQFDLKKAGARDWTDAVGGYFCSLIVDGLSGIESYSTGFDAADPQDTITDLTGTKGKTFGLQFNNFRGIKETQGQLKALSSPTYKDGVEVSYYQTQPLLHGVEANQKAIAFDIPETTNSGVAVVRVK